jgi:hydroxymethylbilane synthase
VNVAPARIATRGSRLALWQAHHVADLLRAADPSREVELVEVSTVGDRVQSETLASFGGFGIFTREVQKAVLDGRADIAVHSLKDLPTDIVEGLTLAAVPERGDVGDALVLPQSSNTGSSATGVTLHDLPQAARIGTGSLRRRAQLLHIRSDLDLLEIRGNVETRLRKLDEGEYDALILAQAGLRRLGLGDRISGELGPPELLPAVAQGALGLECRADDETTKSLLSDICDVTVLAAVTAERAMLAELRAGCHAPVGAFTRQEADRLTIEGVVLSADGSERIVAEVTGSADEAESLGRSLAEALRGLGADRLVKESQTDS